MTGINILVTGGHGQLAYDLIQASKLTGHQLVATSRHQLDINNPDLIAEMFALYQPNIVINTAAYTAVDKAETEVESAFKINRDGPALLADTCQTFGIPLIHISTDFVFDGNKGSPYLEADTPSPLNVYGDSKLQGECEVRQCLDHHIILRVSGVYGIHGNNFVKTMLRLGKTRDALTVVSDQTTCPTPAQDIANTLLKMAEKIHCGENHWGTYHYCGKEQTTWHEFATTIFDIARKHIPLTVQQVDAISTEEYAAPAKRPLHPILNCDKIEKIFNIKQPSWQTSLPDFIKQVLKIR
ncbi:MAG: dTDP-4-dehydrorhamnose reductase [Legionellaceae bacterium]|nr:dTDP-4-dehydrorhamnose reductase [Legionellaceae bacterium]